MKLSRRNFLKLGAATAASLALAPATHLLGDNIVTDLGNGYGEAIGPAEVNFTVTNLVPGDLVFVARSDDMSNVFCNQKVLNGNEIEVPIPVGDDLPTDVVLRVRRPSYIPFETQYTIGGDADTRLAVPRVRDSVYDNEAPRSEWERELDALVEETGGLYET